MFRDTLEISAVKLDGVAVGFGDGVEDGVEGTVGEVITVDGTVVTMDGAALVAVA
jgi:hypothetical protein